MKAVRCLIAAVGLGLLMSPVASAQEPPKPGPEHEMLKKMEGTWDASMNFGGMEAKGTMVYKMELGGLWLVSDFSGEFGGMKFSGKGIDGYNPVSKKFVGIWVDSMSPFASHMEGTWDAATKTMTHYGTGKNPDGSEAKSKSIVVYKDGGRVFTMFSQGPGGENDWVKMMEITYTKAKPANAK